MDISWRRQVLQYRVQKRQFFQARKRGMHLYESYYFSGREKIFYAGCSIGITVFLSVFFPAGSGSSIPISIMVSSRRSISPALLACPVDMEPSCPVLKAVIWSSIGREAAAELKDWVRAGFNIFISGGTGSGKTTFLLHLPVSLYENHIWTVYHNFRNAFVLQKRLQNIQAPQGTENFMRYWKRQGRSFCRSSSGFRSGLNSIPRENWRAI